MTNNCIELFAGVGGFRIGLERSGWNTVWSNQWEPSTKRQHASEVYTRHFGEEGHSNQDITQINTSDIPDHDLLVGGFPCQDYSVAKPLNQAKGIEGKKGVLWWDIYRILKDKRPKHVLLENVSRLLTSPAKNPGKDFAMILECFNWLGYSVEWRVVNAADYGFPQRRKRVFILATYHQVSGTGNGETGLFVELPHGVLSKAFPFIFTKRVYHKYWEHSTHYDWGQYNNEAWEAGFLYDVSESYNEKTSPFRDAGIMREGMVFSTSSIKPNYDGERKVLGHIVQDNIPEEFFINEETLDRWKYLKGAKNEPRTNKTTGYEYNYKEGPVAFPDSVIRPSRTIITGEGGSAPSRSKHVIPDDGRYRRLTPVELERLNGFPDEWTNVPGVTDSKRGFLMGNALVIGLVERIGNALQAYEAGFFYTNDTQN